ncbi:hypothetical protein CWATWH0402_4504 [Crocosphaera watsonii WH 0402]|uniref:Uncharacterized protein n=3 Tax=Crocosphaera watsonii TaxID=263511 RepID=T2JT13_CROWT|nr:hypothetical protein CWATWH0003_B262 [Crocosphaera watsonii WH 0003]CCQ58358.1 hypothetical protein CWATWH0005_4199 [Crocosphaera watsonii WH 0005]CCQ68978.1 hypothetical protein CWATWH0402_4504 [Crocosphaera watsonii WH 0402]
MLIEKSFLYQRKAQKISKNNQLKSLFELLLKCQLNTHKNHQ